MVLAYKGTRPKLGAGVWIAPNATVAGDVELGEDANVWFGTVIRGDVFPIRIGRGTNIQDNCVLHVSGGTHATTVGEDVTVGHGVTLHGCTVGDRALVGIGSIVLDGASIGEEAMVGAGSLVTPGTVIPPRVLAVGSPCRVKRPLTEQELAHLRVSAPHYVQLARGYAAEEQG
jgi:carbonic anhydrase/acetyltransferase-like protein (isoleucine patch superfamily)